MMRKTRVLLSILIVGMLGFLVVGPGLTFQNEPEGFRELKWGDPPTEKMQFLMKSDKWLSVYQKKNDKLSLGDARFSMILYSFYTPSGARVRRLMNVGLRFEAKTNFDILETICKVKFGEPTTEGFYELSWVGHLTTVVLKYDLGDDKGFLGLVSTPIYKQYAREKKKKQVEEAEKDW